MADVTIVIPLFNKARYIARALDSVLAQTHGDFEVVVVDDGSTDNGPDLVKGYPDPRIRLIRQENAGPGAARNYGTSRSQSPLITYLDADDEWMPAFLETSVATLRANPDCDVSTAGYYIGPEKIDRGRQLTAHRIPVGPWRLPLETDYERLGHALGVFHSCATVYRRWVVETYGGFYSKDHCSYGEDVYLWLQILFGHKLYRHEAALAWYHSEASDLGLTSARKSFPIEPSLIDVEPLFRNCPPQYRPLLNRWLGIHALRSVHLNIELADTAKARQILKAFPMIRQRRWEYVKVRTKMLVPELIPHVRRLKRRMRALMRR